jgi:hypothetical protein
VTTANEAIRVTTCKDVNGFDLLRRIDRKSAQFHGRSILIGIQYKIAKESTHPPYGNKEFKKMLIAEEVTGFF